MASHFFFFSCSMLLVAAGLAETAERKGHVEADWEGYKAQFKKHYANAVEEARRKELYLGKVVEVNSHNADTSKSYKKGINHFSDMTRAEFRAHFTGAVPVNGTMRASEMYKVQARQNPPSDLDWRTKGAVTPVKNQGYCGSCWAFSTTGAIEGAYAVATGSLISLSEQFIVSCDNQDYACNGGWPSSAMQYIQSYGGIPTETNYPYASSNGGQAPPCSNPQGAALSQVQVAGTTSNDGNELTLLNMVVNLGPVSVCVDAADGCDWSSYESGIFDEPCYQATDHCVTMVGYSGYLVNQGYWIAKNQWGTNWGEQGYIRLVMAKNMCGLADYGVSPSVQTKTG